MTGVGNGRGVAFIWKASGTDFKEILFRAKEQFF
jgi:hypothetical protein